MLNIQVKYIPSELLVLDVYESVPTTNDLPLNVSDIWPKLCQIHVHVQTEHTQGDTNI